MERSTRWLAGIFGIIGVLHFVKPEPFVSIVPKPLPYKTELVYASGVAELACAALLANPSTRSLGGRLSFWLLLSVYPANIQMTVGGFQNAKSPAWYRALLIARLPIQLVFLNWARKASRQPARSPLA